MHTESNEISSVIDQNEIDNLPINGRRASTFALLTPGVVSNGDGFRPAQLPWYQFPAQQLSDRRAWTTTRPTSPRQRGRTRAAYNISQTAVQEFQVNTSNFSAEYGRSAGGVINTVTKSGGNQFHGELFFYDRDNDFGASNPYTVLTNIDPVSGNYITTNYKPRDWRKQWGFGVGGPILRDKLFFFYSYDQSRRNFPGTATASTSTAGVFAPADPNIAHRQHLHQRRLSSRTRNQRGRRADCELFDGELGCVFAGGYFQPGQRSRGVSAGRGFCISRAWVCSRPFLGPVPRNSDQVINFPKLDYQVNPRNHLILEANRLRASSPNGIQTQQTNTYGRGSFGNDFVKQDYEIARLATTLNATMVKRGPLPVRTRFRIRKLVEPNR